MAVKKIPMRRCAGCNEQKSKKEFVRVVRTPEGQIILDETGKANGRGVYLCPNKKCLQKAKKAGRLQKSLDVAIPENIWQSLEERLSDDCE